MLRCIWWWFDTPDGTGVRDYIHVVDLAKGHVLAIEKYSEPGVHICNLGTGVGYSVLDIVKAFERVNGVKINYEIKDRRPGDIATCYADPSRAKKNLVGLLLEVLMKCVEIHGILQKNIWNKK